MKIKGREGQLSGKVVLAAQWRLLLCTELANPKAQLGMFLPRSGYIGPRCICKNGEQLFLGTAFHLGEPDQLLGSGGRVFVTAGEQAVGLSRVLTMCVQDSPHTGQVSQSA